MHNLYHLGVYSYPTTSLFEITTLQDLSSKFPKVFALLMFVPGKPDNTKQSGRTYDTTLKSHIKFSINEVFELSYALEEAAMTGQCDYLKFADSSKFTGGERNIKKVSVGTQSTTKGIKKFLNYDN
jgi:hypothetical protein